MAARAGRWRVALGAAVLVAGGACSDGEGDGAEVGDDALGSSTSSSTQTFEEADAALSLNIAATGMNIVATEVGLRAGQEGGAAYCRDAAPGELGPHRSTLEAAADDRVRERAGDALAELQRAVDACAGGADGAAVGEVLNAYTAAFDRLRERLDVLLGGR